MRSRRPDLSTASWRKSSYSNAEGGNCVEVAEGNTGTHVPVRDSKHPQGPVLVFPVAAWAAFVAAVPSS